MEKRHIVSLHGSYFSNNYGDILLINLFYKWIKEKYPTALVNLPLVDKKKIKEMPEPTSTGLRNLLKSDCLVYCGGGYFGEQPKNVGRWSIRNFYRHAIVGILAILFRIPIAIIGVEVGPLSKRWFRHIVLWIVNKSEIVYVRNQESCNFLKDYGIEGVIVTADAVLTLNQKVINDPLKEPSENCLVLHFPGYKSSKRELETFVTTLCDSLLSIDMKPHFRFIEDAPNQYDSQYENLFQIIVQKGFDYSILYYTGFNDVLNSLKNAKAVFTTKLHVGITAAAYNRRVFSIYAHPKTLRFHNQIGNGAYCLSLSQINKDCDIKSRIIDFLGSTTPALPVSVLSSAIENRIGLENFIRTYIPSS